MVAESIRLLGCPFCGSSAVHAVELAHEERHRVAIACMSCEAVGPPAEVHKAKDALESWNRRTG